MENNERKNISQYRLIKNGIDNNKQLCTIMDCQPNGIVELIKEQD